MRELRPATWFGEQLLQEWGRWCVQYLETFGHGGGATAGGSDAAERRLTRAAGDYSDPVLAELISTEIANGLNQTLHLRIAERPAIDRRVAVLRYIGRPTKAAERGHNTFGDCEEVIWRGQIEIGGGHKAEFALPEPELLQTALGPVGENPNSIGRELGIDPQEVREATRRLRALAVSTFRRANGRKKRKAA